MLHRTFRPNLISTRITQAAITLITTCTLSSAPLTYACGPYYNPSFVDTAQDQIESVPMLPYGIALKRLRGKQEGPFQAKGKGTHNQTMTYGLADVKAALSRTSYTPEQQAQLIKKYKSARTKLTQYRNKVLHHEEDFGWHEARYTNNGQPPRPVMKPLSIPSGLPKEFELYMKGAAAWYEQDLDKAEMYWKQVLALPVKQRHYREAWALYMLGRMARERDDQTEKAEKYYQQLRERVKAGAQDSMGLATASFGEEGRMYLDTRQFQKALHAYWQQFLCGDDSAMASLRIVCSHLLKEKDEKYFKPILQDPLSRQLINIYMMNQNSYRWSANTNGESRERWLNMLKRFQSLSQTEVDQITYLFIMHDRFDEAKRILKHPKATSAMSDWFRAKLAVRDGKIKEAAQLYDKAIHQGQFWESNTDHNLNYFTWRDLPAIEQIAGELALVKLKQEDWHQALLLFIEHDHRESAAYVAERVMTTKELTEFVDHYLPAQLIERLEKEYQQYDATKDWKKYYAAKEPYMRAERIRSLLGRRLVREGKAKQALPYISKRFQPVLQEYITARQLFSDRKLGKRERAEALFKAATHLHENGYELMATEMGPDWYMDRGAFDSGNGNESRLRQADKKLLLAPGQNELIRIQRPPAYTMKRYHYRYMAADLAWMACKLMPDNDERTAEMLWTAGKWIMYRDPKSADRFYRALVVRCGQTALGQAAEKKRWFPK